MRALITERCVFDSNHKAIPFGTMLLDVLSRAGTVEILTENASRTRQDLLIHGITDREIDVAEMDPDLSMPENILKSRSTRRFDFLIDSDPAVATWAYSQGINSLLALEPKFMDPRFRPDGPGVVSWAHLVDEIESQSMLLASKRSTWEKHGFDQWE